MESAPKADHVDYDETKPVESLAPNAEGNHVALLSALATGGHAEYTAIGLAQTTGLPLSKAQTVLQALTDAQSIICISPVNGEDEPGYMLPVTWERVAQTARRTLAAYHKKNPYKKTMPLGDLRGSLQKAAVLHGHDVRRVAQRLQEAGVLVWEPGKGVCLPEHAVVLPPGWENAARNLLGVYQGAGLNPPPPHIFERDYPRDVNTQAIIRILTESGDLVSLGDNLLLAAPVVEQAKEVARKLAESPGGLSVGTLRNATGSSRKVILPLLEWMDAQNFTKRQGDVRVMTE